MSEQPDIPGIVREALGEPEAVESHEWSGQVSRAALRIHRRHPEIRLNGVVDLVAGELARLAVERGATLDGKITAVELQEHAAYVLRLDNATAALAEGLPPEELDRLLAPPPPPAVSGDPIMRCYADIEREPLRWLWPDRIALGKVSMIVGDPDLGKSLITLDMAAIISTGSPWPDSEDMSRREPGGVVLVSAEDDAADTISPRLDAAGADPSRIISLDGRLDVDSETGAQRQLWLDLARDIPTIEAAIHSVPDCRLAIIDPVSAYLGRTDSHNNSEIRAVLGPLAELAARSKTAVVCVSHLNKAGNQAAVYRITGSLAFNPCIWG
jgi:hypothetical protein